MTSLASKRATAPAGSTRGSVRSPWRTPMARRTYASGILWLAGVAVAWVTGAPDPGGWREGATPGVTETTTGSVEMVL